MAEVKAYTVAVGNFNPFSKASRAAVRYIRELEGVLGVTPCAPRGTLILFATANDAKRGRNRLVAKGIICGKNITECYIDERYVTKE